MQQVEDLKNKIITIDNIIPYLIEHALIDTRSIVDGSLKVVDASRRNKVLKVISDDISLLIKQPNLTDAGNILTINKEAFLYLLMQTDPDFDILKDIAPRILDFDEEKNIMITELITNTRVIDDYEHYTKNQLKEESIALGRAIALYHKAFFNKLDNPKLHFLQTSSISMSIFHPTPDIFVDINQESLKLLKMIQQYTVDPIKDLYSDWENQTLIHGDIKWDNVIVDKDGNVRIADWETASIGDPAWDVGSIFQEFIRLWLTFLPITGKESVEELLRSTKVPIQSIQPSIRAFWNAYIKYRELSPKESNRLLIKSARFCAARLAQSAYEIVNSSMYLSNMTIYMVQISMNMLNNINKAVIQLLGIPFRGELIDL